jgi:hypothetical protein
MSPPQTVPEALEQTLTALRHYADVVESSPDLPREVMQAREAVLEAGERFRDAVGEASGWYTRLFEASDDDSADEVDVGLPPTGQRLSVQMRHDFVLEDPDRLLAAGRAAYSATWPQDQPEAAEQHVTNETTAIWELIHDQSIDEFIAEATDNGLADAGGQTVVLRVDEALADDPNWLRP